MLSLHSWPYASRENIDRLCRTVSQCEAFPNDLNHYLANFLRRTLISVSPAKGHIYTTISTYRTSMTV